ncbi:MAG: tetratricopeptide repeat protein [Flavobacteriaceae bacterium]
MKKYLILGFVMIFVGSISAQKKELRNAGKALDKGNFEKATMALNTAEAFLESMDDKQKSEFHLLKSKLYFNGGAANLEDTVMAIEAFEKVSNPNNAQSKEKHLVNLINHLVNKGSDFVEKNDYSSASDCFSNAYRISKKDTIYLYYAASSSVNAKEYDKSLTMYKELKSLNFTGIEKQYFALNIITNMEEAFDNKLLRDASVQAKTHSNPTEKKSKSRYPEIIKNMALIYNQMGDTEKALGAMLEARAENPDDLNLILTEANVYYAMGNIDKFKSLLEYATELDSENPELQYNLGVIAAEANDVENAKKYYTRAIELNPKYVNAYINLAALILGQEESIIDEMNNLGTSAADDRRYDELRLERKELYFEAIPYLEQAIDIDSNNFQAARTLSNIYSATGDDAKAKEYRDLANSLEE